MKKISIIWIAVALFQIMFFANAVQDFSVSPTSFTQSLNTSNSGSGSFTILNTGDESINLTLSKINLISGSNSITLNIDTSSVSNLAVGSSKVVGFTYTAGATAGTFSGSIKTTNTQNSSMSETIPLTVTVNNGPTGASLELVNEGSTVTIYANLDERETKTLKLRNDGSIDLTNIQVEVSDLEGEDTSDDIDSSDIDINDDGFDLETGDSDTFEIEVDMPRNIDIDTYVGTLTVTTNQGYTQEYNLKVVASGDDINIIIEETGADVRSGLLTMIGKEGETLRNYEFEVSNDGDIDANNLNFELDGELKEEFSSNTIPLSAVTFIPGSIDLDSDDYDTVEVRVVIPEDQASGNYFANIRVESNVGDLYDDIRLKVKVIGDVYIKSVSYSNNTEPGDNLDVNVVIKNQGSQLYRNAKITATLSDVDSGNSDIVESSSSFLLDVGKEKTETLRFSLPEDASDGSHTLEVRVNFGTEELVEVYDVSIKRPTHNLIIDSYAINPSTVRCDSEIYTYLKVKNLGKYNENIKVTAQIVGTNVIQSTNSFDLDVDESMQKNLVLSTQGVVPGDYKVVQKVFYLGTLYLSKESVLRVNSCDGTTGVIIKPTNETITNSTDGNPSTSDDNNEFTIFGNKVEKTTAYLGIGVGAVFVLIIFTLFLL